MMCGCVANIVLDPILIFGLGPFSPMGMEGAALATGLGQTLTLAIYLAVYFARPIRVRIRRRFLLPQRGMALRLYSIGIPATLNLALPSVLISALNAILAGYSQVYILVLGIYYKLQTFLYLPANGIIQGMRPVIGYNYGAGEHKRVSQIYRIMLCMCAVIMALGTLLCLAVPGWLMGLFTHTPEALQAGEAALRIISAGFLVSSVSVVSCGFPAEPCLRPGGGVERLLAGRAPYGGGVLVCLSPGSKPHMTGPCDSAFLKGGLCIHLSGKSLHAPDNFLRHGTVAKALSVLKKAVIAPLDLIGQQGVKADIPFQLGLGFKNVRAQLRFNAFGKHRFLGSGKENVNQRLLGLKGGKKLSGKIRRGADGPIRVADAVVNGCHRLLLQPLRQVI